MTGREIMLGEVREGPLGEPFLLACSALADLDEEEGKDGFHWRWMGGRGIRPVDRRLGSQGEPFPWGWYWRWPDGRWGMILRGRGSSLLTVLTAAALPGASEREDIGHVLYRSWDDAVAELAFALRVLRAKVKIR